MILKISTFIENRFDLTRAQLTRLSHFFFLAASFMAISVFGYTAASALFLAGAGADRIPMVYIIMGIISLPMYAGVSQLIDRFPRRHLCIILLVTASAAIAVLWFFARQPVLPLYYLMYMFFYILWVLLTDILFPSIAADYFTPTELKQAYPLLAACVAVGGIAGGTLAMGAAAVFTGRSLLLITIVLCAVAIGQLVFLGSRIKPLEETSFEEQESTVQALKSFPSIARRYPLMLFLAFSSCMFVLLNCLAEFQVFTIYSRAYPTAEALAGFMGIVMAVQSVLQFLIIYFLTGPLIKRLGIIKMNMIHPCTTLISFIGLYFYFRPVAAVAANINYDSLYQSLDKPVFNLNYNALPHRFIGRARVLADGMFYFLGVALAGAVLLTAKQFLTHQQIALCCIGVSAAYIVLRYFLGRSYLSSLTSMLRSGFVDFDELSEDMVQASTRYSGEIPALLSDPLPESQMIGVLLATRIENPRIYADHVEKLLVSESPQVRSTLVEHIQRFHTESLVEACYRCLTETGPGLRKTALEALIKLGEHPGEEHIGPLLNEEDPSIRALAAVYAYQAGLFDSEIMLLLNDLPKPDTDPVIKMEMIQATKNLDDMLLVPLIGKAIENAPPEVTVEGLKMIGRHVEAGDDFAARIASAGLESDSSRVRAEAVKLLGQVGSQGSMSRIATALYDQALAVRNNAAEALASYGPGAVCLTSGIMETASDDVADAAIHAIARSGYSDSEKIIYDFMTKYYYLAENCRRWTAALAHCADHMRPLRIAIEDFTIRIINRTLHIFHVFGYEKAVQAVRIALSASDVRLKSAAVEALDSLRHRRFTQPLIPLFQQIVLPYEEDAYRVDGDISEPLLFCETIHAPDRWIRVGALMCLAGRPGQLPSEMLQDADPLVRSCAEYIDGRKNNKSSPEEFFMNRLLFLKNTDFFKHLAFDELLALDKVLIKNEYFKGETVIAEGECGNELYLIYKGRIAVQEPAAGKEHTLSEGNYFAEQALFDMMPSAFSAIAETDCVLFALTKDRFRSFALKCPDMLFEFCKVLGRRIHEPMK